MNPINAIGAIIHHKEGKEQFVGTCFSYKDSAHFITACHCIPDDIGSITIALPLVGRSLIATAVAKHETADIAILQCHSPKNNLDGIDSFKHIVSNYSMAEDFITYGYPEDMIGPHSGAPTPRVYKGYFQRFLNHSSHMGYTYHAGELSIPCPGGLSGAPLFRPAAHVVITGLVTENLQASTELWTEESEIKSNIKNVYTYNRVITYGIALLLDKHISWIDEHVN